MKGLPSSTNELAVRIENIPPKANQDLIIKYIEKRIGQGALKTSADSEFRKITLDRDNHGASTGVAWVFHTDRVVI